MDPGWLAVAIAATALGWNITDALRRRRTRVEVVIRHAAVPAHFDGDELLTIPSIGYADAPIIWPAYQEERLAYVVAVVAINRGESKESVGDMRILSSELDLAAGADDGTGPRDLPPRDRVIWALPVDGLAFDASEGFFAEVILGSGDTIRTGLQFLDHRLVEVIDEHNAMADKDPEP